MFLQSIEDGQPHKLTQVVRTMIRHGSQRSLFSGTSSLYPETLASNVCISRRNVGESGLGEPQSRARLWPPIVLLLCPCHSNTTHHNRCAILAALGFSLGTMPQVTFSFPALPPETLVPLTCLLEQLAQVVSEARICRTTTGPLLNSCARKTLDVSIVGTACTDHRAR